MTVAVRSLVNFQLTIDSVVLEPFALQLRDKPTPELTAALKAHYIQISEISQEVVHGSKSSNGVIRRLVAKILDKVR